MSIGRNPSWDALLRASDVDAAGRCRSALSRRRFLAMTGAAGVALGTKFSALGLSVTSAEPNPIPQQFFFPGPADSTDPTAGHDPSLINDFNGFVGVADVEGMATGKNTATGVITRYPYTADLRFMLGEFVLTDGRKHRAAFAFIWLDTHGENPLGDHSYDPGISNTGVLWTSRIPETGVDVHLGKGTAVLDVENVAVTDWFTVPNSLNPAHPLGMLAASIDLHIEWAGVSRRLHFKDDVIGFQGLFLENSAVVAATARTPAQNFVLTTDPTVAHFAEVGHDHNGTFFP